MSGAAITSWDDLERLFSVVMCIDGSGAIIQASPTLRKHMPAIMDGRTWLQVFNIVRPVVVKNASDIGQHLGSLYLLTAKDESFAIRGQIIETRLGQEEVYCFCGAPWLFWLNTRSPQLKLGLEDFSPQDVQLDQLFMMTTEKRMVEDLELLNDDLRVAKQKAEAAQEAKNALFARMSHEMRTPLNGVISALSLLGDKTLPADAAELLQLAHKSSRNLLHVINYVLDLAKIEAEEPANEQVLFDLPALLEVVTDIVRARALEKGLTLNWELSDKLAGCYYGDKPRIRQCLLNLINNAIKFTDSGRVTVRALPSVEEAAEDMVRFEVEDTGPGISESDRRLIFEPFWSGDSPGSGQQKGTGLGLDIVKRGVQLMHGSLGLASKPGEGSIFWLELPLEAGDATELSTESAEATGLVVPESFAGDVLLVDDNETNLLLGKLILESLGVTVTTARDGFSAVIAAREKELDLVLMDISMPGMDGVQATGEIRKTFSDKELPIVALTAYASTEERSRCLAAGMNDYLTKPIVRDRLAEQLVRWLRPGTNQQLPEPDNTEERLEALSLQTLSDLEQQIGAPGLSLVLDEFEAETAERWLTLQDACADRRTEAATREAHTLTSACRSLGLQEAGAMFSDIEQGLRAGSSCSSIDIATSEEVLVRGMDALRNYRRRIDKTFSTTAAANTS